MSTTMTLSYKLGHIKTVVAEAFGCSFSDIESRKRSQPIAIARQVCYHYGRHHLGMTYHALAKAFGRDHAAIIHGCKQVEAQRETNHEVARVMDAIEVFHPQFKEHQPVFEHALSPVFYGESVADQFIDDMMDKEMRP